MQVFAGGRINRSLNSPSENDVLAFRERSQGMYLAVHAAYVISLTADPSTDLHTASVDYLVRALLWAQTLGMDSVVVHPGSAKEEDPARARANVAASVDAVLDAYSGGVHLLLENSAGDARSRLVGRDLNELEEIIGASDGTRVGICLDTCHAFAGGYTIDEIAVLPEIYPSIELVHFNVPNPTVSLGSFRDRHGIFDESSWSKQVISELAVALATTPLIMETRCLDDLSRLRAFIAQAA
jgi:deoxyribonuclease-4